MSGHRARGVLLLWLLGIGTAPTPAHAAATDLDLRVTSSGAVRSESGERLGFVAGTALAVEGQLDRYDVVFVIDVSGSTARPSGADIDGDGKVTGRGALGSLMDLLPIGGSRRPASSGDSVLAAEVAAVRALLSTLDPRNTRVALVTFSGGDVPSADNASLDVPLTSDFKALGEGLDAVLLAGPDGATDMQAGLRIARSALKLRARPRGAQTPPQRHVVFLTDGIPQVPYEEPERSEQRAIAQSRRLGRDGVRVHAFAVGKDATDEPHACVEIARQSKGEFRAVEDPAAIVRLLPELQFASIEEVRLTALDLGGDPVQATRAEDGSYSALVPLRPGENRIEVYARASDGREKRVTTTISSQQPTLDDPQRAALQRLISLRAMQQVEERKQRERAIEIQPER